MSIIHLVINLDIVSPGIFGVFSSEEEAKAFLASHGVMDVETEGTFIIEAVDTEKLDDGMRAG